MGHIRSSMVIQRLLLAVYVATVTCMNGCGCGDSSSQKSQEVSKTDPPKMAPFRESHKGDIPTIKSARNGGSSQVVIDFALALENQMAGEDLDRLTYQIKESKMVSWLNMEAPYLFNRENNVLYEWNRGWRAFLENGSEASIRLVEKETSATLRIGFAVVDLGAWDSFDESNWGTVWKQVSDRIWTHEKDAPVDVCICFIFDRQKPTTAEVPRRFEFDNFVGISAGTRYNIPASESGDAVIEVQVIQSTRRIHPLARNVPGRWYLHVLEKIQQRNQQGRDSGLQRPKRCPG